MVGIVLSNNCLTYKGHCHMIPILDQDTLNFIKSENYFNISNAKFINTNYDDEMGLGRRVPAIGYF